MSKETESDQKSPHKGVSLSPLSFDDAIGGLLAVKPTSKTNAKKKPSRKK